MWKISVKWKERKILRNIKKIEARLEKQLDLKKEQAIQVEILSAQLDREENRKIELEGKYVETTDNIPLTSMEIAINELTENIERLKGTLNYERIKLGEVNETVDSSRNELLGFKGNLVKLRSDFNQQRIITSGDVLVKEHIKDSEKLQELKDRRIDRQKSMNEATVKSPEMIRLEKIREEIMNAKAAGKSEKEINDIKAQKE
jgi:hypothetical protein